MFRGSVHPHEIVVLVWVRGLIIAVHEINQICILIYLCSWLDWGVTMAEDSFLLIKYLSRYIQI